MKNYFIFFMLVLAALMAGCATTDLQTPADGPGLQPKKEQTLPAGQFEVVFYNFSDQERDQVNTFILGLAKPGNGMIKLLPGAKGTRLIASYRIEWLGQDGPKATATKVMASLKAQAEIDGLALEGEWDDEMKKISFFPGSEE